MLIDKINKDNKNYNGKPKCVHNKDKMKFLISAENVPSDVKFQFKSIRKEQKIDA